MILLSNYYLRNYTKMNEVEINGQPQGSDDQNNNDPEDFTAQPVDLTGRDNNNQDAGNDNSPDNGGGDNPSTDNQGNDAGGNTEDFTQDEGGEGDDPEDFTADSGGDDMGENSGGDAGGGDSGGDVGGGSSGSTEDVEQTADDARAIENDIFDNLTPSQIDVKHKELKNNFVELYDATSNAITRVNDIPTDERHRSTISFVNKQLSDLRDLITDYMQNVYSTKSYMENAINYNKFLAQLDGINRILDVVAQDLDKNKENN